MNNNFHSSPHELKRQEFATAKCNKRKLNMSFFLFSDDDVLCFSGMILKEKFVQTTILLM